MPAQRLPWIKFWPEALEHEKFSALTDAESWTWIVVWSKASLQPKRWRFASVAHAAHVTARPVKHIRRLIEVGLLDDTDEGLSIHDARQWQDAANIPPTQREGPLNDPPRVIERPLKGDRTVIEGVPKGDLEGEGERDIERDEDSKTNNPPDPPVRGKPPKAAREVFSDADEQAMLDKWTTVYGSDQEVSDEIRAALNHNARKKCTSERLYVDNWLRNSWKRAHPGRALPLLQVVERRTAAATRVVVTAEQQAMHPCPECGRPTPFAMGCQGECSDKVMARRRQELLGNRGIA